MFSLKSVLLLQVGIFVMLALTSNRGVDAVTQEEMVKLINKFYKDVLIRYNWMSEEYFTSGNCKIRLSKCKHPRKRVFMKRIGQQKFFLCCLKKFSNDNLVI